MRGFILFALLCPVAAASDCLQVDRLQVQASDLAGILPAFASLPAATVLGYTPAPGLRRSWSAAQLSTFLARHGAQNLSPTQQPAETVCVERPSHTYSAEEIEKALRAALAPEAQLELVDFCRMPMPAGQLRFELRSLARPVPLAAKAPLLWRGHVSYDGHRRAPFWATVRVSVPQAGFYAATDLAAGHIIAAADIVRETHLAAPHDPMPANEESVLIGFECRRAIRSGTAMRIDLVTRPAAVSQGDVLQVTVESGSAQVKFQGRALASGRQGESILVENTQTGKRLRALVEAPGRAIVQLSDPNDNQNSVRAGTRAGHLRRPVMAGGAKAKETGAEFAR